MPLLLLTINATCQYREIGVFGGVSYYTGELNPSNQFLNIIKPIGGLFYKKNLNKRYSLKLGASYGFLLAKDQINFSELSSFRNLSFSTSIMEIAGTLEFNFLPYEIGHPSTSKYSPFVFIGLAAFRVAPKVIDESSKTNFSSSTTIAPSIPFGLGLKFNLIQNLGASIEWSARKTYTDLVDGLSEKDTSGYQISNTQTNDWYSSVGITVSYKIIRRPEHCSSPDL